ncbi:unnamed protein product [Effrenium voratum]|uniref:Glycoside hydrolase family 2 catalytic domain-containing protein n=1 Tax=Effrenium voratum TaxID=2562239 RepID=A0AA36JF10_9DINO|nr:unnamed protein product [Effrenium voratum]CAJ1405002.1 unnamed protein product [Effrenium voratum]CAJ1445886.1 unnamed protein product [Effrenium voratum]
MRASWVLQCLCFTFALASPHFWPRYGGRREVAVLDGEWLFGFNDSKGFDVLAPFNTQAPGLTPQGVQVPSSVDAAGPGILGRRGVAMYRTHFQQKGHARLQFMGCSFYCRVFVDGKEVGEHRAGGYVPWWLDLEPASATRELFVLADNRFNKTTAPLHTGGDFWHYGGLVRSVLLHDLPDSPQEPWVWRAHVLPREEMGIVDVNVILTSAFSGNITGTIVFDGFVKVTTFAAEAKAGKFRLTALKVPFARPWSLQTPHLHTLTVRTFGASVTERFGLRTWGVKDGRVTLNGEVVKLHGWNHHTQWVDTGASPTDEQLSVDMALLREGNANFVRGAHYPQDQRWLDRLDTAGFAMWEETLGPGVTVKDLQDSEHFMKYQLQQLEEMLEASMNHPSIMVWAWFNEGPSDQEAACPAYAACAQLAASRDSTRFLSWASNKKDKDKCLDHATAISFNSYPAWYSKPGDLHAPGVEWNKSAAWARAQQPQKPFFVSETGAGGIFEWKNKTDVFWSLKYQQEVIDADVDTALADDNVSGIVLWHFFDFKGNDDAQACGPCKYLPDVMPPTCGWYNMTGECEKRPGGLNHKGVVDAWRRKKPSFESVRVKYGRQLPAAQMVVV